MEDFTMISELIDSFIPKLFIMIGVLLGLWLSKRSHMQQIEKQLKKIREDVGQIREDVGQISEDMDRIREEQEQISEDMNRIRVEQEELSNRLLVLENKAPSWDAMVDFIQAAQQQGKFPPFGA